MALAMMAMVMAGSPDQHKEKVYQSRAATC
jgi:hypothetical protein